MANNLPLLLATLAASLLLLTAATITDEARLSSRCEHQLRCEKMKHCRQYLKTEIDIFMNPGSGNQECCLRECCEMLQEMDKECMCEALESIADEESVRMSSARGGEGRRMGRVALRKAMQLPGRCGIRAQCEPSGDATITYS